MTHAVDNELLVSEQSALRRLAALVATGATSDELFNAVALTVAEVTGANSVMIERYEADRSRSVLASLGAADRTQASDLAVPITIEGKVWGLVTIGGGERQDRLAEFAELAVIAIANAEARERGRRVADEQAALRRVATLVGEGVPAADLFPAVVEEIVRGLGIPCIALLRYEPDRTMTVVASSNSPRFPVARRGAVDDHDLAAIVQETGRSVRVNGVAGVPIVVAATVWGLLQAEGTELLPLQPGAESRLRDFTELIATAIANAEARDRMRRLADEQAALRRVATLVAEGATPDELFSAVAREAARLLDVPSVTVARFEPDGSAVVVASLNAPGFPVDSRWPLEDASLSARVLATAGSVQVDYAELPGAAAAAARASGMHAAVGVPIIVDGRVWGLVAVGRRPGRGALPLFTGRYTGRLVLAAESARETEARLAAFTELVATAVSNAAARAELVSSRARIVTAGDEARRRFERNLHDGTQQRLLALRLDLERLRNAVPEDAAELRAGLEEAEHDLQAAFEEVREVSRGLHPVELTRGGLPPSLRALADRSPIQVELRVDLAERPSSSIETAVYYAVSEALANATKHSRAETITVTVAQRDGVLRASVADDGVGGALAGPGSGLTGLRDRVEALGGRLALDSAPGRGTTITFELPT